MTIDDITRLLLSKRRIVILVGAGISVSCGIPDFRSANGLYNTIDIGALELDSPEDLFDIEFFHENPERFYKAASEIFYGKTDLKPSAAHEFIKLLADMNLLLRVYTQNIDGLEEMVGISRQHIIEAHGSLQRASCLKCRKNLQTISSIECDVEKKKETTHVETLYQYIQSSLQKDHVPTCPLITNRKKNLSPTKDTTVRKRKLADNGATSDEQDEPTVESQRICGGVLKPGITFFGEKLSSRVGTTLEKDRDHVDLLLVMGTSLSVCV